MIDEAILANLLTEHAMAIPVPESAIGDLLAASPRDERLGVSRFTHPSGRLLAAAAVVTLIAAGGVWALGGQSGGVATRTSTRSLPAPGSRGGAGGASAGEARRSSGGATPLTQNDYGFASPAPRAPAGTSASKSSNASSVTPTDSARVVRTASLDLSVKRHTFGPTISRITTITAAEGGFISDEKTYESAAVPSGAVTVRVPSARFNSTVEKLRALGTVESATTRGVDVTGQYVDLGARLAAATATRDQYLTVLAHATNIGDILAVQDRIQGVQTQIEQLQGQLNELNNQTTYATITTSVSEPTPKPKPPVRPHHKSGVAVAWGNARHGFSQRVEGIISYSGSVLVVALSLLLLAGALRLLFPRIRRLLV
jgi:hypothetical protein